LRSVALDRYLCRFVPDIAMVEAAHAGKPDNLRAERGSELSAASADPSFRSRMKEMKLSAAERKRALDPLQSFSALSAVVQQYAISRDVVCEILHLSRRNLLRRRQQNRLSPDESDRLYRLARVLAHANRVFEDPEESADWIQTPNTALGKHQPLTLLDTDIGVQQVDQVLGRIEHGIIG
jgi:putative toxin-antitoxin system antitoxin component (TIGR02293 family)